MATLDGLERMAWLRRELENPAFARGHRDSYRDDCDGRPLALTDEVLREACRERHGYTGAQVDAWVRGYRDSALSANRSTHWMVMERY